MAAWLLLLLLLFLLLLLVLAILLKNGWRRRNNCPLLHHLFPFMTISLFSLRYCGTGFLLGNALDKCLVALPSSQRPASHGREACRKCLKSSSGSPSHGVQNLQWYIPLTYDGWDIPDEDILGGIRTQMVIRNIHDQLMRRIFCLPRAHILYLHPHRVYCEDALSQPFGCLFNAKQDIPRCSSWRRCWGFLKPPARFPW